MLTAMVEEVAERGAGNVTVAHVVERAVVSRRTFYEIFKDREDCFLAAFDDAIQRIAAVVIPAYEGEGSWRVRLRAALSALLECLEDDHGSARLLIVESLAAGTVALERRRRVLEQIITAVDEGRREIKNAQQPPPLTAEGVVGGVLSVLHARLTGGDKGSPPAMGELAGPLMGMIVLPYLGAAAARREADRLTPKRHVHSPPTRRDPLRELEMRLTYRTIRALMVVAAHPGSSNRKVGDGAGTTDQGQISKLLARLHNLGLIENTGAGPARGEPNAWTLTAKGREVHAAIARSTSRS
jgi:AcrR family transcriptional regulator